MDKLAFVGNSESPSKLLELFRKQTPGRSGVWGELTGIDNYEEAEYFAVIDRIPNNLRSVVKEDKCVFLGAHPETMQAYQDMSSFKGIKMYDLKHTFGFLEWWIKYDYDFLSKLEAPKKLQNLCAIISNANTQSYHKARLSWVSTFCKKQDLDFNLYGRLNPNITSNVVGITKYYKGPCGSLDARGFAVSGNDHMSGKEDVLFPHRYIVEFDATGENYFSERVADDMLLWCMPIYWGGSNVHKYLPENSFRYFDINGSGEDVLKIINSNFYDEHIEDLSRARRILLDELQIWPRVHQAIYGKCK